MNTFTVQPATAETLSDLVALVTDREDAARRLSILRERLAGGQLLLERTLILRSEWGVEGHVLINAIPRIPIIPHLRADVPEAGVVALAHVIREHAEPEQQLLLTDALAPLDAAPLEAAGWVLDSQHVIYETELRAQSYPLDLHAQTVDPDRSGIRGLLEELGQPDLELSQGWTLIALPGGNGSPVALGAVGPGGRPGSASINLIGVLPQGRGQGMGTRLHAHLMALAAQNFGRHDGGTEADNAAMRRIFDKHGSRQMATQLYFIQEH
ncbi:GNAT family N-acetyltransferase [Deinococcus humi]|uniref:Ribosomal protein S18 acetylase RimI-like enzyme n=1 Tax=Deinococcus humi TaxID=662880 RepID=A0A7W8JVI5_9DEIO|nr:GNAT family N-acetyltransferase [Deinococcus humi]MBB5362424.1 ribosomal protein S18 acetylase RimI-like enzyme [Deinococcus humi]GGO28894.1 GNAT family N-acetyltransferase [Deinococcus humi]